MTTFHRCHPRRRSPGRRCHPCPDTRGLGHPFRSRCSTATSGQTGRGATVQNESGHAQLLIVGDVHRLHATEGHPDRSSDAGDRQLFTDLADQGSELGRADRVDPGASVSRAREREDAVSHVSVEAPATVTSRRAVTSGEEEHGRQLPGNGQDLDRCGRGHEGPRLRHALSVPVSLRTRLDHRGLLQVRRVRRVAGYCRLETVDS